MSDEQAELQELLGAVSRLDPDAYVVGGAVRDRLTGIAPDDMDVSLSVSVEEASDALAAETGARRVVMDDIRGHVRLVLSSRDDAPPAWLDLSSHRGDLAADLSRRDFTINSMAVPVAAWQGNGFIDHLIDPFDGMGDLERKSLRETAFGNIAADPARVLRAARFATRFELELEPGTADAVRQSAPRLTEVSAERVRDEIYAIFASPDAMKAVKIMDRTGALATVFPELEAARGVEQPPNHHFWDVFEHCVQTVGKADAILDGERRRRSADLAPLPWRDDFDAYFDETVGDGQKRSTLLRLAALLHDVAKPETKSLDDGGRVRFLGHAERGAEVVRGVLERLRCSRRVIEHVSLMVREHLRPGQISSGRELPSRRAVFRYYRDLGNTARDAVFLSLSDYLAARGPRLEADDWQGFCRVADVILNPAFEPEDSKASLLLNGNQLQRYFGLRPGPVIGRLLGLLRESEATGRIQTREEAIEMLRNEISRSESRCGRTD